MTRLHVNVPVPFPPAQQRRNYPQALKRECPVCFAKPGEACMPASLAIPHLARCRDEGEAA